MAYIFLQNMYVCESSLDFAAQIENLEDKLSESVPALLRVPMLAAPPPPVKSCFCSRNEEEYRHALEAEVEATNKRFLAMY